MFIDKLRTTPYDVAIVGSGPAGISAALRLEEQTNAQIILIESGGMEIDEQITQLAQVDASGIHTNNYYPAHAQRVLGGTSNVWVGFCTTLEERSFMNGEWPMPYEDIQPYYKDAATVLELPPQAYNLPAATIGNQNEIVYKPYYLSPPVRFKEKYSKHLEESQQIEVLLNTTCTGMSHNGRIETLALQNSKDPSAPEQNLSANHVILACGGLGNPRLLHLAGIANNSPNGNYFMGHPHIYEAGEIELDKSLLESVLHLDGEFRVSHALQLGNEFCLEHNLLNFGVGFGVGTIEERPFLGTKIPVYVSQTVIRAEMAANPNNRVYLGEESNPLGQPITKIDFNYNYQQLARDSWEAFSKALLRNGIGRASTPQESYAIFGGGHYIGTTRLGANVNDSVADANCKVHELANLYLAGSSIFPAAGAANPTFSIVAFALRLADHLATQL